MLNVFLKILKYILITMLIIVIVIGVYLAIRVISKNAERKKINEAYEISEIREYTLGGHEQKVMIEGKSKDLPILVFLHGGPGIPMPWNVGSRGLVPEITDKHIFVVWDQYGSGINRAPLDDNLKIDTLVKMSKDLVRELKDDFPDNKIILFGVSWGSVLTARLAAEMPESIDSIVVYGQITADMSLNEENFNALRKSKLPDKDKERLEEIAAKKEFDLSDALTVSVWINKYTNGMMDESTSVWEYLGIALDSAFSPDYGLRDGIALMVNDYDDNDQFMQQIYDLDLRPLLDIVKVPYTIIQGEYDLVTSTTSVQEFVKSSVNPKLSLEILEGSSHTPSKDAIKQILEIIGSLD